MSIYIKSPHEYINATVVGTPTIIEGVVSGFSTSNYLTLPNTFNPESNTWEVGCKFTTAPSFTEAGVITKTHSGSSYNYGFRIAITATAEIYYLIGSSSSTFICEGIGSHTLTPNTTYYVKFEFTGSAYNAYLSTNGEDWELDYTFSSTQTIEDFSEPTYIGTNHYKGIPFTNGSIDLTQSYIKINGEYWWRGVEVDQYREIKRLYQYKEPTYYKYGTEIDASVTGSFGRLDKGVASGFTTANYLTLPNAFDVTDGSNWEMVYKVRTSSNVSSDQYVFASLTSRSCLIYMQGSRFAIGLSSASGSWNIVENAKGTYVILPETDYWIKLAFDGSSYTLSYSLDGVDYINDITKESTSPVYGGVTLGIGIARTVVSPFLGSIDLTQSYININGERWWSGDEYTKVGSWIDDAVVRGFTSANYLNPPSNFTIANGDTWEFFFKCKTPETFSTYDVLYRTPVEYNGVYLSTKGNVVRIILSSNGTSYNMGDITSTLTLETNTDYYIKYYFTGSQYKVDVSTDSLVWENYITLDNSTSIYSTVGSLCIGAQSPLYTSAPWGGSIDLSQSYIKINGQDWWHGTKVEETTADDYEWLEKIPMLIKQVYKTDKTKYYKYVWEDWTQPILTANGTMGGDSFAVAQSSILDSSRQAWTAFDNAGSASSWHSAKNFPQWISWYNPKPLKTSNIRITNRNVDGSYPNAYQLQYSDDNSTWTTAVSGNGTGGDSVSWNIPVTLETHHKYWRLYITSATGSNSSYVAIGEIQITAQEEKIVEVTADDDHDYSELIPQLVYEHNPTVFQQSTAGTYIFNVTEEAPYEITLVGGGGGGAFNSSGNAGSAAAGNSGSGLVVNAVLKAGTYVLNVGAGGAWSGWLDANTWGGNGSQSSISKDGVVLATAGGGTGNHAWWRSGSAHNSTVGAAPTYTDALGVRDVILNRQGNWGGLAATSSGGASVISGTTWGKGGDTRNRNAADNGNAGCIRIVRLEK